MRSQAASRAAAPWRWAPTPRTLALCRIPSASPRLPQSSLCSWRSHGRGLAGRQASSAQIASIPPRRATGRPALSHGKSGQRSSAATARPRASAAQTGGVGSIVKKTVRVDCKKPVGSIVRYCKSNVKKRIWVFQAGPVFKIENVADRFERPKISFFSHLISCQAFYFFKSPPLACQPLFFSPDGDIKNERIF